jgi:hypothetical protein
VLVCVCGVCVCVWCVCVWCVCTRARLSMLYPLRDIHHHHHHHHHLANMKLGHLLSISCLTRLPWLLTFGLYFFIILVSCKLVGREVKLENLTVAQLFNKFPSIYGIPMFFVVSIRVCGQCTSHEHKYSKAAFEEPSQLVDHRDISNTVDCTCACRVEGASDSDILSC